MKIGDLVRPVTEQLRRGYSVISGRFGLVLEWYDTPKGVVTVGWWHEGNYWTNPIHVSKLEVISESRNVG